MQTAALEVLEKALLPSDQARAILRAMELEWDSRRELLATKAEMKAGFDAVRGEIRELSHSIDLKLERLRSELMRGVFTIVLGQTAVLMGALYFIVTFLRK